MHVEVEVIEAFQFFIERTIVTVPFAVAWKYPHLFLEEQIPRKMINLEHKLKYLYLILFLAFISTIFNYIVVTLRVIICGGVAGSVQCGTDRKDYLVYRFLWFQ